MFVHGEALYNGKKAETTFSKDVLKTFTMDFLPLAASHPKVYDKERKKSKSKELRQNIFVFFQMPDNNFVLCVWLHALNFVLRKRNKAEGVIL